MFTGIVEEIGTIESLTPKRNLYLLRLKAKKILSGIKIGDSIAVNGVCLTVTARERSSLVFDIMKETINSTTLKHVRTGGKVNLERALKAGGRFDGHMVTGHIDTTGMIKERIDLKNYVEFRVGLPEKSLKYIVPKGSVTLDGVSLTVGTVKKSAFSVYLIPHTLKVTTLGAKSTGDTVNIETDILAKYILNKRQ